MSEFFYDFPKVDLKYTDSNNNDISISYTDIYRFIDVNELSLTSFTNYQWYDIKDGDRPDNVSNELYGTADFYWTFFIINERMKNGTSEWPLSNQALDRRLAEKYDQYGVCTIFPGTIQPGENDLMALNSNVDLMVFDAQVDLMLDYSSPIAISNFVNGLDLSHEWLRVKRVASSQADTQFASIKQYDNDRYQLWLKDVKDSFFFSTISQENLSANDIQIFLYNPYDEGTDEYDAVEAENDAWVESMRPWYVSVHGAFVGDTAALKTAIESKMIFTCGQFYETGSIAPDYYIDTLTGERLCNLFCNITGSGTPIPNFESERTVNEAKRRIRVLKPSVVYGFIDKYRQVLKESGRLSA